MSLISGFVKSLSKLSMIGRALMLPISLLPAAGLLLAFGDKFHLPLMMNAGGVIFDNLPMLLPLAPPWVWHRNPALPHCLPPSRCLLPISPSVPC